MQVFSHCRKKPLEDRLIARPCPCLMLHMAYAFFPGGALAPLGEVHLCGLLPDHGG